MTDGEIPPELIGALTEAQRQALIEVQGLMGDTSAPLYLDRTAASTRTRRTPAGEQRVGPGVRMVESTVDQAVRDIYRWDSEKLVDFQRRAFEAGLYGTDDPTRVRFGDTSIDPATFDVWVGLVESAAGFYAVDRRITPWDALDLAAQAAPGIRSEEPGLGASSMDVEELGRQTSRTVLGRGLSPEELAEFQQAYRAMETQHLDGTAGESAPSPEVFAQGKVREFDPTKADARAALRAFEVVAAMFEGL